MNLSLFGNNWVHDEKLSFSIVCSLYILLSYFKYTEKTDQWLG